MKVLQWILTGACSALAGFALVRYLTVPPLLVTLYAILLALSFIALALVIARYFRRWSVGAALLLALIVFTGAYLFTNQQFLNQEEPSASANIPTTGIGSPDAGHTAVIYLTHGEPPAYSPMPWIETMREFDKDGAPFIPVPFRPFFFNALRQEYMESGGSPHNFVHQSMVSNLEEMVRKDGDLNTRFYLSFLDSDPRPDAAVIQAINEGADRIVLVHVFLTISSHTKAGMEQVEALGLEEYDIDLCEAGPLWDSPALKKMFVERANKVVGSGSKDEVGILLVGHGQPAAWDELYPTQTEQENQFRYDVVERLSAEGYPRTNISLAWMEFKEPDVQTIAEEIGKQGIKKLLVYPVSISATSLHSEYDIPEAVREANLPDGIEIINMGAWNNDPLVIEAIRDQLRDCGL